MTRAVLFDLFGTLVHFEPEIPSLEGGQREWRKAMSWLEPVVRCHLPGYSFEAFLDCLTATTNTIVASRAPEYHEIPSVERFRWTLARLGIDRARQDWLAPLLAEEHMANLTKRTHLDVSATTTLEALQRQGYQLGLVSNFDSEPAAWHVLEQHGLLEHFGTVLISAGFGRRKPHRSIFLAALQRLGASASGAWFVGDNYEEDILGAQNAGLRSIWVRPQRTVGQGWHLESTVGCTRQVQHLAEVLACID